MLLGAGDAMARPGHGFQALLLKFLFAFDAGAVRAGLDAPQRFVDQGQHGTVDVGLAEEEFLGVGIRGLVRKIHRRIVVRRPAFFLGPGDGLDELLAPGLQFLSVVIQTLLIHDRAPLSHNCRVHKPLIVGLLLRRVKEATSVDLQIIAFRSFRRGKDSNQCKSFRGKDFGLPSVPVSQILNILDG